MSRVPDSTRAGLNGTGGYTNGYHDSGSDHPYETVHNDGGFNNIYGGGRDWPGRPGSYGGFGSIQQDDTDSEGPHVGRPTNLDRSRANRRSGGSRWGESRSRSRPGAGRYGEGSRQIEEVLQHIGREWDFMSSTLR